MKYVMVFFGQYIFDWIFTLGEDKKAIKSQAALQALAAEFNIKEEVNKFTKH